MSQFDGGITVDEGYRAAVAGSSSPSPSRPSQRAARSSPGAWDEDLGKLGSEPWEVPGMGEKGPRCGTWQPSAVCDSCGHVEPAEHQCGRRSCPECWSRWAREGSVRATVRLQAFRSTLPDNYERQSAHAVVSPNEGDIRNSREFTKGKARAAEIAREKGFRGFAVIAHPFRMTDDAKREFRASDVEYGIWVWWRNDKAYDMDLVYWSPHYHIIGSTTADMDEGRDTDEWMYAFIRSHDRFDGIHDSNAHSDVYGNFRYLLSHTGYPEGSTSQAITWYGDLANNKFVEDATEDWQHQKPSSGRMSALKREVESVAGISLDDDESDGEAADDDSTDDVGECPCEDCDGRMIDVLDVKAYLRHNNPPPDVSHRMVTAYEWLMGEVSPPPGMKHPETDEHFREAFETML